jgi:hypothetical protein
MAALPDGANFCTRCGLSLVEDRVESYRRTPRVLARRRSAGGVFVSVMIFYFTWVVFEQFVVRHGHFRTPIYTSPSIQVIPAPPLTVDRNYFQPVDPQRPHRTDNSDRRY